MVLNLDLDFLSQIDGLSDRQGKDAVGNSY